MICYISSKTSIALSCIFRLQSLQYSVCEEKATYNFQRCPHSLEDFRDRHKWFFSKVNCLVDDIQLHGAVTFITMAKLILLRPQDRVASSSLWVLVAINRPGVARALLPTDF